MRQNIRLTKTHRCIRPLTFPMNRKRNLQKGLYNSTRQTRNKTENGTVAWSQTAYDFIRNSSTPDSANPSLWRNTELNSLYGLFEVVDGVYQVRGYDVANVTFVKSDNGWIVLTVQQAPKLQRRRLNFLNQSSARRILPLLL